MRSNERMEYSMAHSLTISANCALIRMSFRIMEVKETGQRDIQKQWMEKEADRSHKSRSTLRGYGRWEGERDISI